MEKEELIRAQKVMLGILCDVDELCKKNNIQYFLDGGTMLGAVRHQGFIPWDDDLDIGMLREHYERFLSIASKELPDVYFVQEWKDDSEYGFWFAKVRLKGTVFREKNGLKNAKHNEFFIDVFPYDNYPDSEKERNEVSRKIEFCKRCLLAKTNYSVWYVGGRFSLRRFLLYKFLKAGLLFYPKQKLINKFNSISQKYNSIQTKCVYPQGNSKSGKFHLDRKYFNGFSDAEFEMRKFPILNHYDEFLKTLYGDYMTLPPLEERYNRHNVIEIVFPDYKQKTYKEANNE
ncbi:MAG: LicD family protein [Lachnospiraceae bacterium]|nr:LicD family protein [Lachnospiraceae bacterium]